MNLVVQQGNLTRDPELRYLDSGVAVVNFSIAINESYKTKNGEKKERTEFFECEAWDKGAEVISQILHKGDPVLLDGSLRTDKWEKDGQKFSRTKVRVNNFKKLARYQKQDNNNEVPTDVDAQAAEPVGVGVGDEHGNGDDIPF